MPITFAEFAKKYQGERNSAGIFYTPAMVAQETGMDLALIEKWGQDYMDCLYSTYSKTGAYPSDDQIIAMWEAKQVPPVVVQVPPGMTPFGQGPSGLLIKETTSGLLAKIEELIIKHKG